MKYGYQCNTTGNPYNNGNLLAYERNKNEYKIKNNKLKYY